MKVFSFSFRLRGGSVDSRKPPGVQPSTAEVAEVQSIRLSRFDSVPALLKVIPRRAQG